MRTTRCHATTLSPGPRFLAEADRRRAFDRSRPPLLSPAQLARGTAIQCYIGYAYACWYGLQSLRRSVDGQQLESRGVTTEFFFSDDACARRCSVAVAPRLDLSKVDQSKG
jgi:hypothetical protein